MTSGAAEQPAAPRFPVTWRGYERHRVDAAVGELINQLADQQGRLEQLERELQRLEMEARYREDVPPSFADLGAEAAKVFEQAGAAAEELLGDAVAQAEAIIQTAEAKADEVVRSAEERAAELEQAAREMLADAEFERSRLEADAAEVAEQARARAEEETKALIGLAMARAESAWEKATTERSVVEAEINRLRTVRRFLGEQLKQMQAELGLAVTAADRELADSGAEPTAALDTAESSAAALPPGDAAPPDPAGNDKE